jgi:quinol-cytochrome oxidoreductase complex cytochrome b subunit
MFFMPQNFSGWLIALAGLAIAVYIFTDIDNRSHSASDTLRPFIINLILIYLIYSLLAFILSYLSKTNNNLQG